VCNNNTKKVGITDVTFSLSSDDKQNTREKNSKYENFARGI